VGALLILVLIAFACGGLQELVVDRCFPLLFHLQLLNECSKMRRHGSSEAVVLVLQALPDCREPNEFVASRIGVAFRLSGMASTIQRNRVTTYPVIKPIGCGIETPTPRIASPSRCCHFVPLELGSS
jgi:hypothetical protein